jgi:hypothetical protein
MNIRIDNDYKLTSDERNVILTKISIGQSGKSKGKEVESNIGYYATIEHALNDYLRIKINTSQATSINELKAEIREVKKTIQKMMEDN